MGDWSFIITSDWHWAEGAYGGAFHLGDGSVKWCWLNYDPNNEAINAAVTQFSNANRCSCNEPTHGRTKPLWDEATKTYYFP